MLNTNRLRTTGVLLVTLAVLLSGVVAFAGSASAVNDTEITVTLEPTDQTVDAGQEVTYDVVVEGATDGIEGYELTVELSDGSVATFTDFQHEHDPQFPNEDVNDGSVNVSGATGFDTIPGADSIVLGTLTLSADAEGATDLSIVDGTAGVEITDSNSEEYTVVGANDGALTVEGAIEDPVLSLSTAQDTIDKDNSTTLSFDAGDITNGVSAFAVTIGVADAGAVDVTNPTVSGDSSPTVTENSDGGITVQASPNRGDGDLTLASFDVVGSNVGTADLSIDSVTVTDSDGSDYSPRSVSGTSLTVEGDNSASIELRAADDQLEAGEETTVDVVAVGPGNGISAYQMEITADTAVGSVTDFQYTKQPDFGNSDLAADGSSLSLSVGMGANTFGPADEAVIAEMTVQADAKGDLSLSVGQNGQISDTAGNQYDISSISGTSVSVTDPTAVELRPAAGTAQTNGETTVEVVVTEAIDGINAYEIPVGVNDTAVASIVDYNLTNSPQFDNVDIASDGSEINLSVGMGTNSFDAAPEIVVAELTLQTGSEGTAALSYSGDVQINRLDDSAYDLADTAPATFDVIAGPPSITGDKVPNDLDGDGLFEDVDGNDNLEIFDVQTMFLNFESDVLQQNSEFFNFSGGNPDKVTIFDIQQLFAELQSSSRSSGTT